LTDKDRDIKFLRRSLELAAEGVGRVSPNPLVGCVIVSPEGEILGEGTYLREDVTHAEVIALSRAGTKARGATAYVSLEPHSHHGKTPPCTDALINAGIRRVVAPMEDPNPLVSGKGFESLRAAGVEVVTGMLSVEAERLNEKFVCWHRKNRPFVHLKMAMSIDGRISLDNSVSTSISGPQASERVHSLRHEYDAILVGATTAVVDDPALTDRSGKPRIRPLVRVILDNSLRLPPESMIARTANGVPTLVMTNCIDPKRTRELSDAGVEIVPVNGGARNLANVLDELRRRDIQSVLVEGGSAVAGAFVDAGLVDKFTFLMAPFIVGGATAPVAVGGSGAEKIEDAMRLRDVTCATHGEDIEITGYPKNDR
jgi:diaminohydroxyphosphoribosylaminopyrimidine deaminase / 5-amino-6-(5-phosphoribosylamino)uracil reductase